MVSEVNGPRTSAVTGLDPRGTKIGETRATDAATATRGQGAEVVTLTDLAARLQALTQSVADLPVADQEKIEQFRQSVADGSYEIDPQAVAEKLTAIEAMLSDFARRLTAMSTPNTKSIARAELEARLLELTSLLASEYDAIRERDTEQLARLADDKHALVARIDAAARSADVSALLADPDTSDVEELRALMHRAQHANRINGAAIESSQLFTSSLLDILRGRVPGERTYTARGRLGVQAESMPLVSV